MRISIRRRQIAGNAFSRSRRTALLSAALISFLAGAARAAETFEVPPSSGEPSRFTIHLPSGWQMSQTDADSATRNRYVFASPAADGPYLFCRLEDCTPAERDERLREAIEHSHRALLSGGDADGWYFDPDRFVVWKLASRQNDFVVVDATLFGEGIFHLKFFTPQREFREFVRIIRRVVENVEVHGEPPEVDGQRPEERSPPTDADLENLFTFAEDSPRSRYLWMGGVGMLLLGLYLVERTIRVRRHKAAMAELDRQQQERREKLVTSGQMSRTSVLRDAESYANSVRRRTPGDC